MGTAIICCYVDELKFNGPDISFSGLSLDKNGQFSFADGFSFYKIYSRPYCRVVLFYERFGQRSFE